MSLRRARPSPKASECDIGGEYLALAALVEYHPFADVFAGHVADEVIVGIGDCNNRDLRVLKPVEHLFEGCGEPDFGHVLYDEIPDVFRRVTLRCIRNDGGLGQHTQEPPIRAKNREFGLGRSEKGGLGH